MLSVRRICSAFGLRQKRRDSFEWNAVEMIHGDIKSRIDQTVAIIVLLFEAITFTLRNVPNYVLAWHVISAALMKRTKCSTISRFVQSHTRVLVYESMSVLLTRWPVLLSAETTNVIAPIGIACNGDQWATMTTIRHHAWIVENRQCLSVSCLRQPRFPDHSPFRCLTCGDVRTAEKEAP